jgi:hypothetical protein
MAWKCSFCPAFPAAIAGEATDTPAHHVVPYAFRLTLGPSTVPPWARGLSHDVRGTEALLTDS